MIEAGSTRGPHTHNCWPLVLEEVSSFSVSLQWPLMRKLGAHFKEEMTVGIPLLITKCALKKASESERQCFLKKTIYYLFIHLFLALLGLSRWAHAISSCSKQGATLVVGHRLLIVVASCVCVCVCVCVCGLSHSGLSDSLQPYGL